MIQSQLSRIISQVENELNGFENELNKLSASTYPTSACDTLLRDLRTRIDRYRDTLKHILDDYDADNPNETIEKLITKIHNPSIFQEIKFLDWIRNAQTAYVPWSFVPCIEDIAKNINPEKNIIVCSDNNYNYSIKWSLSERLAPYPYYILILPRPHRVNILWHCLIGHELFHPRCHEFIDQHNEDVLKIIKEETPSAYESVNSEEEEDSPDLFSERVKLTRITNLTKVIHYVWRRAMEELLSDMACVELFGPGAIFAMKAFMACSPANELPKPENDFYPSGQYRIEVSWNSLNISGYDRLCDTIKELPLAKEFLTTLQQIKQQVEAEEGEQSISNHPYAKIAYQEVKNLIPEAREFIRKRISNNTWYQNDAIEQIPELVKRLSLGIPPNELIHKIDENENGIYETEPAYVSSILIAGWIYEAHWQENHKLDSSMMKYMDMCRLLLKACEDSRWLRQKK